MQTEKAPLPSGPLPFSWEAVVWRARRHSYLAANTNRAMSAAASSCIAGWRARLPEAAGELSRSSGRLDPMGRVVGERWVS
jgi:hypothetical protein